jgi:ketosteroid isomerase-like protein
MATVERPTPNEAGIATERARVRRGWFRWVAAILVLAVVGAGIWLALEAMSGDDLLPGDVQNALDDYENAWRATDSAAFLTATTTDYVFATEGGETDADTQAFNVGMMSYWKIETLDRTVTGEGPYVVTTSEIVYPSALSSGDSGQSVVTIEEADGSWKVSRHVWTETP